MTLFPTPDGLSRVISGETLVHGMKGSLWKGPNIAFISTFLWLQGGVSQTCDSQGLRSGVEKQ